MLIGCAPLVYNFSFFPLFGEYRVLCCALRTAIVRTAIENIRLRNKE